ncbi:MAG: class I SAM-dependent methyltransferase [Myxococcota bacterium]|nr:class I SAM-dependent methyltransferase [Myxococcota bacterium]
MAPRPSFDADPRDPAAFTRRFDRFYSATAGIYDFSVRHFPAWRRWLRRAVPHLRGPRVLEVSCGTGYLLTCYAGDFETHALDYNLEMLRTTRRNLRRAGAAATLCRGRVEALPYADGSFDTVVNTMAFSGFPDGRRALAELVRVLAPGGRLVLIDVNHPDGASPLGRGFVWFWRTAGDIVRDMGALFREQGLRHSDEAIGGFGSVRLYVAERGP